MKNTKKCLNCKEDFLCYSSWPNRVTCSRKCSSAVRFPLSYPKELYGSRFYAIWSDMKTRCYNEKSPAYQRYGGRGIEVCERWHYFANFYADMFDSYKDNLEVDRIDNDGSYEPSNCRWATRKEQCNNRSTSRLITINGETRTLSQWIDLSGLKSNTVRQRFYVYKWPIERALNLGNLCE